MNEQIKVIQAGSRNDWVYVLLGAMTVAALVLFSFFSGIWYQTSEGVNCYPTTVSPVED